MGLSCGVGSSLARDSYQAGLQASKGAIDQLGHSKADFFLAFSTEEIEQEAFLKGVRAVIGDGPMVGCCSGGIITYKGVETKGVAVMVIRSEELLISTSLGRELSRDSYRAGEEMASAVSAIETPPYYNSLFLMLPDGFSGNPSEIIRGAYRVLGASVKYIGGGTGDNLRFLKTYQFLNYAIHEDAVAGALISSKDAPAIGIKHGWTPTSRPMVVTRARGKEIYELDGRPAFDAYVEASESNELTLEDFAAFAMTHPLGIPQLEGEYIIRDPIRVNQDRSISCVAEVPQNSVVRIMRGDANSIIASAEEASNEALTQAKGKRISGTVIFNCISRFLLLGKEGAARELEAIRGSLGKDIPIIGLLTFGEIGAMGGPPAFHNKTIAVWLLTG